MVLDIQQNIFKNPIVAFDTETSGAYPIESEIIELGAVKWLDGKVIDQFQVLLKPAKPLTSENIKIHGITNEMLENASQMKNEIAGFCKFIDSSVLIAHHAPFDLGFLTLDIEKSGLAFPHCVHLCTSLISRALLTTTNHKLQTLIKELNLEGGKAHRAYDDAYACLQVLFKCIDKLGSETNINRLLEIQKKIIGWNQYKIYSSSDQKLIQLAKSCESQKTINIVYSGGQTSSKPRPIKPFGIVRNPDGDFVYAECGIDKQRKRFYIDKILDFELS